MNLIIINSGNRVGREAWSETPRTTAPRLPPTFPATGAPKTVFTVIDNLPWRSDHAWIRAKSAHRRHRIGMTELRCRFCGRGWRLAHHGVVSPAHPASQ
jgi:hypothetical protein